MIHLQIVLQREVVEFLCKHSRCSDALCMLQVIAGAHSVFELLGKERWLEGALADFMEYAFRLLFLFH